MPPTAVPTGAAGRRARIAAPTTHERYQTRVGSALTPQVVSSVLRSADLGEMERQADLLDEVKERDGHLQAVLSKRAGMVSGAEWELVKAPRTPKGRAAKILALCNDALTNLTGFSSFVEDLLDGTYQGRAICEGIWTRDGRYQVPERYESVHARRHRYAPHDWQLRISDSERGSPFASGYGLAVDEINALIPGKLVVHCPRVRGGYPTREGLGRTTVWYSGVFKAFGWRDFLAYLEQYGRPLRIGFFGTGKDPKMAQASDEDVDEMLEALDSLSSAVAAVFPDTTRPELFPPATASAGAAHPELVRMCDAETSKAVLGGTLTTDAGTKGARSLGDTHKDEEIVLAKRDARAIAETIRRYVLVPIVVINGLGTARDAPTLRFVVEPSEDLDALAKRFETVTRIGVGVPVKHVRDRLAIPDPEGDEQVTSAAPKPAEMPAPPAKKNGDEAAPKGAEPSDDADEEPGDDAQGDEE